LFICKNNTACIKDNGNMGGITIVKFMLEAILFEQFTNGQVYLSFKKIFFMNNKGKLNALTDLRYRGWCCV